MSRLEQLVAVGFRGWLMRAGAGRAHVLPIGGRAHSTRVECWCKPVADDYGVVVHNKAP